jgi:hypothetical protein
MQLAATRLNPTFFGCCTQLQPPNLDTKNKKED